MQIGTVNKVENFIFQTMEFSVLEDCREYEKI